MLEPLLSRLNDLRIILASSSPQRAALLKSTKLKFEICPSTFDEDLDASKYTFSDYVEKTAMGKVDDVWQKMKKEQRPPDMVIGVDTMVTCSGRMYGKPKNKEDAIRIVSELIKSDVPNVVYSGVVVKYKEQFYKFTEVTMVHMAKLSDEEILSYVETGEPMGKAGGYGIQGIASTFVQRIEGDCNNVIGLPLCRLAQLLKEIMSLND